jgi:ribonuclease R
MASMEQKILKALRPHPVQGLSKKALAKAIGLKKKQTERFFSTIDDLILQDKLLERSGYLYPAEGQRMAYATITKVSGTFGFARPDGAEQDVFIPGKMLIGAMPGDRVWLRISADRGELEKGEVFRIVEQSRQPFAGTLQIEGGVYAVVPDHSMRWPLPVVRGGVMNARPGDKVLAEIATRGERHSEHTVRIITSFGSALSAEACSQAILAELGVPTQFPDEVKEQARAISAFTGIHPKEIAARLDLREEVIFTIDGADSKDLDDAISLKKLPQGWELGVHIADVSHYVTPNSPLDLEAFRRGTSVYYADSVVPMLPPELSNGICSLNPGEDRLAFSCLITLDSSGVMTSYRFKKSVIHSRVKGVYSELNALLEGSQDGALEEKYADIREMLLEMQTLAQLLIRNRQAAGKMELDSVEGKIVLDEAGEPVDVYPRERGFCERLIEEFMLLANEAAATFATEHKLPFVYRIHENPSPDKLEELYEVLARLGISFRKPSSTALSKGLSDILNSVEGTPYAGVINVLTLRSMAKARYSHQNIGHFGLSLKNYAHFTSPIRRYPDLTVHRILSAALSPMKKENLVRHYTGFAAQSAEHSFQRELVAVNAERSCEDCYKASYMGRFIGQAFEGVVSGCTAHGAYVQLPNTCEGLVKLADFPPGDWGFDGQIAIVNATGKGRIQLGDTVRVKVLSTNVSAGQIDFALVKQTDKK